MKGNIKHKLLN